MDNRRAPGSDPSSRYVSEGGTVAVAGDVVVAAVDSLDGRAPAVWRGTLSGMRAGLH